MRVDGGKEVRRQLAFVDVERVLETRREIQGGFVERTALARPTPRKSFQRGIRGTCGSNLGPSSMRNLVVLGFGRGFDLGGEHLTCDGLCAAYCIYGFAFNCYKAKTDISTRNLGSLHSNNVALLMDNTIFQGSRYGATAAFDVNTGAETAPFATLNSNTGMALVDIPTLPLLLILR